MISDMKTTIRTLLVTAATLATVVSSQAGNITVKGSDTLVILAQKWAEAQKLLDAAPKDQAGWTPQERDEVICLAEWLTGLKDPSFT